MLTVRPFRQMVHPLRQGLGKVFQSSFIPARSAIVLFALSLLLSTAARLALAEIHTGFAMIPPGPAWDFSDSVTVVPPSGDLRWITLVRSVSGKGEAPAQFAYFLTDAPAQIAFAPQDSTYENLSNAPPDSTFHEAAAVLSYGVYVVRTKENHFAKLRIEMIGGGGITIEYSYQDNGSRVLVRPVGVKNATWGSVKSLYRRPP
jgi:hypothetical protein